MDFKSFFDIKRGSPVLLSFLMVISCDSQRPLNPAPTPWIIYVIPSYSPVPTPIPTPTPTPTPLPTPTPWVCYPTSGGCVYPTPVPYPTPYYEKIEFKGTFPLSWNSFTKFKDSNEAPVSFESRLKSGDLVAYLWRYTPDKIKACEVIAPVYIYGGSNAAYSSIYPYSLSCDPSSGMDGIGNFVVAPKYSEVNVNTIIAWGNKAYFNTLFSNVGKFWSYGSQQNDVGVRDGIYQ